MLSGVAFEPSFSVLMRDLSALTGSQPGLRWTCSLSWVEGSESGF